MLTAYVQRASPTLPIEVLSSSEERKALVPNTSLVEKHTTRSQRFSFEAASRTLAEPTMFTRIVLTVLLTTVSIPAMAAQCTTSSAPSMAFARAP